MVQLIKYSIIRKIKNFNIIFWPCIFPLHGNSALLWIWKYVRG